MTKRTCWSSFITTLLILGLAACGGSGGGGGGGGGIPSATNAAITPPPTSGVAITTAGGVTSSTNQDIAAKAFQASTEALGNATAASLLVGVQAKAKRDTLGAIVRRHAEKLKDHKSSVTGAVQVITDDCSDGGTMTVAFDDANGSATDVFVNCNLGGLVTHGTISSSNVRVTQDFGSTVGSAYTITVKATLAIDLSSVDTASASTFVMQGSFDFTTAFHGNMQAAATGGVEPGPGTRLVISMDGTSFLTSLVSSNATFRELLANFNISVDDNDLLGTTTTSGGYTYASTIIGGSVTVSLSPNLVQPQGGLHPTSGAVTITALGSPGKIVLTVISSPVVGVRVDVHANAAGPVTDTVNLTWAELGQP